MKKAKTLSLFLLLLFFMALFLDLYENGFAAGGACDFGFGKRLKAAQEIAIRGYFLEELPNAIEVKSVTCTGFTDSTLVATFHIANGEAEQLVAALEATFLSQQNHPMVSDAQKQRKLIGSPSHRTYSYFLPGLPLFDVRTVSVSIPKDIDETATVVFDGGNY
jgi:hypothetical protein